MFLLTRKSPFGLLIIAICVAMVSCIPDTGIDPVLDQEIESEMNVESWDENPVANLKMDPETLRLLSALRESTSQFHQFQWALDAGFEMGSHCVEIPGLGGMGYHYVNFPGIFGEYDPSMPQALLYEPMKNGKMRLVGVEFVLDKATWDAANEEPPFFGSREFDFDNAIALPFPNYQLHIWIWKNNPSGIFEKFNPTVSCQ